MNANITYLSKDHNRANESTTYWFTIDGALRGIHYDDATFGVVESGADDACVVDCDGYPETNAVRVSQILEFCVVTDEMRAL